MKKNNFGNRNGLSIMKKILMILIISFIATLTYCGNEVKDEVNDDAKDESTFSIPSWIMGTWSNDSGAEKFVFSTDNIVLMESTSSSTDFKETFTVTDKTSTDTSYTLEGTPSTEMVTLKWSFVKKGDNQFTQTLLIDGEPDSQSTVFTKEAEDDANDESTFGIPSWIMGTWSIGTRKFVFSTDNVMDIDESETIDWKALTVAGTFTVVSKMSTDTS